MAKVDFTFNEAWDLIFLLKSIVANSEYCENTDLYSLRDDAIIVHNKGEWERLQSIFNKLVDTI